MPEIPDDLYFTDEQAAKMWEVAQLFPDPPTVWMRLCTSFPDTIATMDQQDRILPEHFPKFAALRTDDA